MPTKYSRVSFTSNGTIYVMIKLGFVLTPSRPCKCYRYLCGEIEIILHKKSDV